MKTLRFVLGDQLTRSLSSLDGLDPKTDAIFMCEAHEETVYVRHHQQKIALILSAMRHFARDLRTEGLAVDYVRLNDDGNTGSFTSELIRAVRRHGADWVVVTEPGEWRVLEAMRKWQAAARVPVEIRADNRFFASIERFKKWAHGRKSYRMEFFYRDMRRAAGILMDGEEPCGGQWNFDSSNRKPLAKGMVAPERRRFAPDAITQDVLALVKRRFGDHFGEIDGFGWPVTRNEALLLLDDFIANRLPRFGDYQDAMQQGAPFLYHAAISSSLNIGLLTAKETCLAAEAAYRKGQAPLNAAEGFIRQILGWREYVRGIYWLRMPDYAGTNALNARRPLPWFYWSGETGMNCVAQVVNDTRRHAYAHHIQRLMITGNFALLAGIDPRQVEEWYLIVYADAFDWVELPNTHGMALYADGGLLASKPYAASGAYIDRMSDYCGSCMYDPKVKSGPKACPFNVLYWDFLMRNKERLSGNPRLAMAYRTLAAMDAQRRSGIARDAAAFLDSLLDSG